MEDYCDLLSEKNLQASNEDNEVPLPIGPVGHKRDATQGIDFSAGYISVAICNRALPTMGCDFTVIIVAFLVKLHMLND